MLLVKCPLASRRWLNRKGTALGVVGTLAALALTLCPGRVVIQARRDQSVPFRVGIRLHAPARWERGQLVMFRTRDLAPYYPAGSVFTKIVMGIPGDRLRLDGRTVAMNGVPVVTARTTDSLGRPAPLYVPFRGPARTCETLVAPATTAASLDDCIIPPGTLFVLGTHERSFDSRYWGLVNEAEIIGRVIPLL